MSDSTGKPASEEPRPQEPPGEGTSSIHRSLHRRSAVNTLLFYGTVLIFCLLVPVIVATGVGVFFLFFYKREIRSFLRSPLGKTRLRRVKNPEREPYRLESLPPGAFDRTS